MARDWGPCRRNKQRTLAVRELILRHADFRHTGELDFYRTACFAFYCVLIPRQQIALCNIRVAELCGLRWCDIDSTSVHVNQITYTLRQGDEMVRVSNPPKTKASFWRGIVGAFVGFFLLCSIGFFDFWRFCGCFLESKNNVAHFAAKNLGCCQSCCQMVNCAAICLIKENPQSLIL